MIKHVPGDENEADIFTENTMELCLKKTIHKFVGVDKYMDED